MNEDIAESRRELEMRNAPVDYVLGLATTEELIGELKKREQIPMDCPKCKVAPKEVEMENGLEIKCPKCDYRVWHTLEYGTRADAVELWNKCAPTNV